jgi:hypothetical protein
MPLVDGQKSNTIALWDRIGISASTLCLIHCLLTPLMMGALPLLNLSGLLDQRVHQVLAVIIVLTCGLALIPGFRRHRRFAPLGVAVLGLALLFSGAFMHAPGWGHELEAPLTIAGGVVMVSAHLLNLRFTRRCDCCPGQGISLVAGPESDRSPVSVDAER